MKGEFEEFDLLRVRGTQSVDSSRPNDGFVGILLLEIIVSFSARQLSLIVTVEWKVYEIDDGCVFSSFFFPTDPDTVCQLSLEIIAS